MGQNIRIQTDLGEIAGYLSLPQNEVANVDEVSGEHLDSSASESSGPGLLLLSEWWGLVDQVRDVADRFAKAGFVTLAPDFFDGSTTESPEEAGMQMMSLETSKTNAVIRGAAEYLHARDEVSPKCVAALGFGMGGQLAIHAGCEHSELIQAVVDFYGIHPSVKPDISKLQCPVLAHFGEHDDFVPRDEAEKLISSLRNADKKVDVHFYAAGHAFFNGSRAEAFHEPSAATAFERSHAFLRENLVG